MDIKEYYSSLWAWGGLLVATILSLYVYWYTSLAFSPTILPLANTSITYFAFIITGELALMIPTLLLEAPTQVVKQAISTGAMTTLLQLPTSRSTPIISWTLAKVPTELLRLTMNFTLIFVLFGGIFSWEAVFSILFLALLTAPIFLGIGLVASSIVVTFGRGERMINFAVNALSIFSGIYFPVAVLPDSVEIFVRSSSPLYWLLEKARQAVSTGVISISGSEILMTLGAGLVFTFVGVVLLRFAFALNQKTGAAWILRY